MPIWPVSLRRLLTVCEIDFLKFVRRVFVVAALFAIGHAFAETGDAEVDPDQDFELPGAVVAGLEGGGGMDGEDVDFVGNPLKRRVKSWPEDLVIAPVPGRSPQLGWKLSLAAGYFLEPRDEDSDSAPSLLGGFAMIAENGSYAYGAGANLHLMDDKLRVKAGAGYMDVRYRFFGMGDDARGSDLGIDIVQEAPIYIATATWRVWNKLYLGVGYLSGNVETGFRYTPPNLPFFDPRLKLDIGAYTIPVEFDTRDHQQFPRKGWLVNANAKFYRQSAGSDFDAETYKISVNHYRPMRGQDALAFRAYVRSTTGEAPFFLLSTFGGSTDLRGYPSGRYRDQMMYALQSEYRWQFTDSWIFTGFAGFGEVAKNFGDFGDDFLPAAGIGARFVLSKKHRVGLSADIAVGKDGTEFYFGVGEAF